jgi:hypothetical protein
LPGRGFVISGGSKTFYKLLKNCIKLPVGFYVVLLFFNTRGTKEAQRAQRCSSGDVNFARNGEEEKSVFYGTTVAVV